MTLCGPATESYTYLILAPAVILALVQAFDAPQPARLRALVAGAFVLQLVAAARASFLPHFKPAWALSILPCSALVFSGVYPRMAVERFALAGGSQSPMNSFADEGCPERAKKS